MLPDNLSYQDVWQQPFLLTIAYARGLQYWAEKLNLPDSSDFCPLAGSVVELKEMVKEHMVITNWDLLWDLEKVDPRAMNLWPQTNSTRREIPPLGIEPSKTDASFTEATTQAISLAEADTEPIGHTTIPVRTEGGNWYLLVVTALIEQLSLESVGNGIERSLIAPCGGDTFQNPQMAAVLSVPTRTVSYGSATMKELEE